MPRPSPLPGYSTAEVARLVGVSEGQIRAFAREEILEPRRGGSGAYRFTFADLVILRVARELREAGLSPQRLRRALRGLRQRLPRGRSLAAVRLSTDGHAVVVHDGGEAWLPESGQRLFDFQVSELAARAAPLARRAARDAHSRSDELDTDDWFELGYELEATDVAEASRAYRRVLELDPSHPDALVNLGRLLHEEGAVAEAERLYRRAAQLRPGDPTPVFNLGVALQDLGRLQEAVDAYRRTVDADPRYRDAYYNLAGLYERLGDPAAAIRELKAYRSLVRGGG